jgi:uncharacterized membrane protein YcaP (DUF421 family)
MLFDSWAGIGRTILVGVLAYFGLVALLRVSGKRTLSKMNAFDLVVTVALGSTLSTILLSKDVALAEGLVAFIVLIALQYIVAWLSVRSALVRKLVKSEPTLVLFRGRFLEGALRQQRVTEAEVIAAVRAQGAVALDEIEAVVLETDGSLTAMRGPAPPQGSALTTVGNYPPTNC